VRVTQTPVTAARIVALLQASARSRASG
jgi:hypothetical protein